MQKLENNTLQTFLERFVEELKIENGNRRYYNTNTIDIPFIISSLHQNFQNNTNIFNDFIHDLENYPDYNIIIFDSQNDYNGIIDVDINLVKGIEYDNNDCCRSEHPDYDYKLCFRYDTRNYRYCECTPDMPDYREDKQCCGHGCDASFCSFSLHKVLNIVSDSWSGDEHDYWEFEDEFYLNDKELADKKAEEDKARMIEELKNRIEADQKKLAELEGE